VLTQTSKVNMPDQDIKQLVRNSPAGMLAKELSYPENYEERDFDGEIVLIELNHFFAHHCGLPAIIRALRSEKKYRFIPYIPLVSWEAVHPTLELVQSFYECMGIEEEILKAAPSLEHFEKAKSVVSENLKYFQGEIWNLTDFEYDELPIGVHLVETLLQQFKSAEFDQNINTVAYSVGLIARYLWWKEWLLNNQAKYIIASHNCYEFVLPQLAATKIGVAGYVWHDNYIFNSINLLPLPAANDSWYEEAKRAWQNLGSNEKEEYLKKAQYELSQRTQGVRTGALRNDPRFISGNLDKSVGVNIKRRNKVVVIYCHAFSDAPCTLPKANFGYLCSPLVATRQLLEIMRGMPVDIYIKMHPNPFPQDEAALEKILTNYPEVNRITGNISPKELRDSGVDLFISGWGSICFEASYIGAPVLAYTTLLDLAKQGLIASFDINNSPDLAEKIDQLIDNPAQIEERFQSFLESYAVTNFGREADITCSRLIDLPREGDAGRYAPLAYKYWSDTIDKKRFELTAKAISIFISSRQTIFSQFHVRQM
jgi:hypothetical protein